MPQDMLNVGYFRSASIAGDRIVFLCEDDVWSVDASGGVARRLTNNLGPVGRTIVSPVCAYTDKEEAEKHIHSVQHDLFGDTYYFWQALEVKDRYEPDGPDIPGSLENQRHPD